MSETESRPLTASDLLSCDVKSVRGDAALRDAARQLAGWGVHGAPVVDDAGRCVGVLSITDLARWASGQGEPRVQVPRACSFQEKYREPGGRESILCRLAQGVCPLQRLREIPGRGLALVCAEPHCVPTDWQVVELESLPGDAVRDYMTTTPITVEADTPVPELARRMLEHGVYRLVVLDTRGRPAGIVSVSDLLRVLAHLELVPGGDPQ